MSWVVRALIAVAACATSLVVALWLSSHTGQTPYFLFLPAVILAAWFGGRGAGLLAVACALVVIDFYVIEPGYTFLGKSWQDELLLATFGLVSLAVALLTAGRREADAARHHALRDAEAARHDAEMSSRLKDQFLATLSHELRTPLNAVLGWARCSSIDRSTTKVPAALAMIERNAQAQKQLVDDLLDVSAIVSGRLRLDPRTSTSPKSCAPRSIREAVVRARGISLIDSSSNRCRSSAIPTASARSSGTCSRTPRSSRRKAATSTSTSNRDTTHRPPLRPRHRPRHRRRIPAARVRAVPSGGQQHHAHQRRPRPRALARPSPRRGARRHGDSASSEGPMQGTTFMVAAPRGWRAGSTGDDTTRDDTPIDPTDRSRTIPPIPIRSRASRSLLRARVPSPPIDHTAMSLATPTPRASRRCDRAAARARRARVRVLHELRGPEGPRAGGEPARGAVLLLAVAGRTGAGRGRR